MGRLSVDGYLAFLAPDVAVQFDDEEPMTGREAARQGLGGFGGSITAMEYALLHEPLTTCGSHGRRTTVRATAWTDHGPDGQVTPVRLDQDVSALYAPSA